MPIIAAYDARYHGFSGLGAVSNPNPPMVSAIADAVTQQEGYYPGSAAYRYNNPGNLMDPSHRIWPQYPTDPRTGEVIFPDAATGRAALENDLSIKINRGMTLTSLFAMYAPAGHGANDPAVYAANVAHATGIDPNTPLNQVTYGGQDYNPLPTAGADDYNPPAGFDLTPYFEDSSPYTSPETIAGVSSPAPSAGVLVGLGVAALAFYFAFVD
jgi:hypothetical protein